MNLREQFYPKIKEDREMEQKMQEKAKRQDWAGYNCLLSQYKKIFSENKVGE